MLFVVITRKVLSGLRHKMNHHCHHPTAPLPCLCSARQSRPNQFTWYCTYNRLGGSWHEALTMTTLPWVCYLLQIPLGTIPKNENNREGMTDIMDQLHTCVPVVPLSCNTEEMRLKKVLLGVTSLQFPGHAQLSKPISTLIHKHMVLQGLALSASDWHTEFNLMEIATPHPGAIPVVKLTLPLPSYHTSPQSVATLNAWCSQSTIVSSTLIKKPPRNKSLLGPTTLVAPFTSHNLLLQNM